MTLSQFFQISTDYRATSLNFHHQIPRYISRKKLDWCFGATFLGPDTSWSRNGFAVPDYNDHDLTHCCLKSLEAAEKRNKTIFLLLPEWKEKDFYKLLQGPFVRKVALWKEDSFRFLFPIDQSSRLFPSQVCLYMFTQDKRQFPLDFLAELRHRSIKEMGSPPTVFNESSTETIEKPFKKSSVHYKSANLQDFLKKLLQRNTTILGAKKKFKIKLPPNYKNLDTITTSDVYNAKKLLPRNAVISIKDKIQTNSSSSVPKHTKKD